MNSSQSGPPPEMGLTPSGTHGSCTPCCNGVCIAKCRGGAYHCQHCGHWEAPSDWEWTPSRGWFQIEEMLG